MNRTTKELLLSLFLGFVLPGILLSAGVNGREDDSHPSETKPSQTLPHEASNLSMRLWMPVLKK